MKKIKISLAAMGIAIGALGAFAFSPANNVSEGKLAGDWYLPLDPNMAPTDPGALDFSNYDATSGQSEPLGCSNENIKVCAAHFPDTTEPAEEIVTRGN